MGKYEREYGGRRGAASLVHTDELGDGRERH